MIQSVYQIIGVKGEDFDDVLYGDGHVGHMSQIHSDEQLHKVMNKACSVFDGKMAE